MYKNKSSSFKGILISILKGLGVSALATLILSIAFSLLLYTSNDPLMYLKAAILSTVFISVVAGSIFSSTNTATPIASALAFVLTYASIMLLLSLMLPNGNLEFSIATAITAYLGAPVLSLLIVWAKANFKSNQKRIRPKKYR